MANCTSNDNPQIVSESIHLYKHDHFSHKCPRYTLVSSRAVWHRIGLQGEYQIWSGTRMGTWGSYDAFIKGRA